LWEFLQRISPAAISPHVPTTGFIGRWPIDSWILLYFHKFCLSCIGFAYLMHLCESVTVFELIPSMDYAFKKPCYYYNEVQSEFCYTNGYHPKEAEISLMLKLNVGNFNEVFRDGYATIPGLNSIRCTY
jgi:hypothetical protein